MKPTLILILTLIPALEHNWYCNLTPVLNLTLNPVLNRNFYHILTTTLTLILTLALSPLLNLDQSLAIILNVYRS